MDVLHNLPQLVTAIGGLGTAAFGLVDATKVFWGGVNHVGFGKIAKRVISLTPPADQTTNALSQAEVLDTLKGNWFNGTDLKSQKLIAKSLLKLHLNSGNAAALAKATNIDPVALATVVNKQAKAESLSPDEGDLYARLDLIITAMLDETYQMADQDYRNGTRALAVVFSVGLIAGWRADSEPRLPPDPGWLLGCLHHRTACHAACAYCQGSFNRACHGG